MLKILVTSAVFLLLVVPVPSHSLTVMSVDFGAEFMKVAVVAPGMPMEIALNKESKRKTPMAIAFRDGERTFGDDAITAGMRSPSSLFTNLLHLLGKDVSHPIVLRYIETHPQHNIIGHPDRNTVVFKISDTESYSVEELVAQLLSHATDIAAAYTNQKVKDLVITVPAFFNQAERRALLDSADIAGLKVLSLISSNAAVGLNYGMFRRKEINGTAQHLLFYDMGSSQTTASVVSYQTVKTKERGYSETNPQVTILGVGFDRTLGGYEMQLRLRDFLATKFNEMKKTSNDVFKNARALNKLNKEAGKLKHVLSANNEFVSQVENVMEDIDLKVPVTRAEFEELISDLVERSTQPISDALVAAGLDKSAIDQLVLVGGSTRVPIIQDKIQELWERELGRNINADEAGALGAVYRAADMGQGFKVKTFHVKECNLYPIEVEFVRTVILEDGSTSNKAVKRSLFAVGNTFPQKKVMTFNKNTDDFDFRVNYGDLSDTMPVSKVKSQFGSSSTLLSANVNNVTATYAKHITEENGEFKGIKAHFNLDASGLLHLGDIEMVVEKNITVEEPKEESTFSKIGSTLTKLFGGEDDNSTDTANATDTADEAKTANETEKKEKDKEATKETAPVKTSKLVTEKLILDSSLATLDLPLLGDKQLNDSMQKLSSINEAEAEREKRAAGRNTLESRILDIKDKMSQDDFIKASVESDQTVLSEQCNELEDWLYDEGFDAAATIYAEKVAALNKIFKPIESRVREHRTRPQAIQRLMDTLNASSHFVQQAREAPADYFTPVELQKMDDLIVGTQSWLEQAEEEQAALELSVEPTLSLAAIGEKGNELEREMKYLINKAKLAHAKAEKEAAEAKAKAEKEAQEAELKKKKEQEAELDYEDKDDELLEKESRQEPVLPEEPEPDTATEESIEPDAVEEAETRTEL